jgi:cyclic pyranopterin phosphate synthase
MPEKDYVWLPRKDILDFEEMSVLVDVFADLGVDRIRLTGGEPLVRRDLDQLVRLLAAKPAIRDLAMTTNGVLLAEKAAGLKDAGSAVTVSLDTLDRERFQALTRFDDHERVLEGIAEAGRLGFSALKIDTVVIRGVNEDELAPILEFGRRAGAEVRFIEYMDVGGATQWSRDKVVPRAEMLGTLARRYGPISPIAEKTSAPAERFRLADGYIFGIIASTTAPFCGSCDRSRPTADGLWYLCLYAAAGTNPRAVPRGACGRSCAARSNQLARARRPGAKTRAAKPPPLVPLTTLRRDPHLEMHTRGG